MTINLSDTAIASLLRRAADKLEIQPVHVQGTACQYGADGKPTGAFCAGALIARLMYEDGVLTEGNIGSYYMNRFREGGSVYVPICDSYSNVLSTFGAAFRKVEPDTFCHGIADYNDSHTKEEVVGMLRRVADVIEPRKTLADLYPPVSIAPNLHLGRFADTSNVVGPDGYRRRLLAWAELLESDMVSKVWDYETYGRNSNMRCSTPDTDADEFMLCGTAGCAGGWLHLTPEAWRSGFRANFYREEPSHCGACDSQSESGARAWEWLGLEWEELAAIIYAESNRVPGMPPLSFKDSSPADVAAAIRFLADTKYPVVVKRVETKGTKRWYASFFRRGAEFLETHNHVKMRLYRGSDDSYCAAGACAAAVWFADKEPSNVPSEYALQDILRAAFGGDWYEKQTELFGPLIARASLAIDTHAGRYQYSPDDKISAFNDAHNHSKGDAAEFLRTLAYMLEHGGALPRKYRKYEPEEV